MRAYALGLLLALVPGLLPSPEQARAEGPGASVRATVDAGDRWRRRCDLEAAREAYEAARDRDPLDAAALAGLAEVERLEGRLTQALGLTEQGLLTATGRRSAGLWRVRAETLIDLGDADLALHAARRSVALDPRDARGAESLARAHYRAGDILAAGEVYRRAVGLDPLAEDANLRLGSGFGDTVEGAPWRDASLAGGFAAAVAAWGAGDLEGASLAFAALCRRAPDVYKFRLGLGLARRALRRRAEVRYGGAVEAIYLRLPAPPIEGLASFVLGYEALDPVDAHAARLAVAPARRWLPALREQAATHAVFGLDASLAELEGLEGLRGVRTFDGRRYEHLRGVGGRRAASGVERLREAAGFGYHLFAHEFGHQVLRFAFPPGLQAEVEALHARAAAEDRCLDWYAAANADEYFAQGYEAFVSHAKRGCLKETQRHTREELANRDPALYEFLEANLDTTYETEEALASFRAALAERD